METMKIKYNKHDDELERPPKRVNTSKLLARGQGQKTVSHSRRKIDEKAALKLIEDTNMLTDPLAKLTAFKIFHRTNIDLTITCCKVKHLSKATIAWLLNLTKENMQLLYDESDWGWNEKIKRNEMTDPKAWYLIAQTLDCKPVGFVHFRFDLDFDIPVLYCYEIQLEPFIRRSGLGRHLMLMLELMAKHSQMKKVMLTVFKHNEIGRNFFIRKMRYEVDETSPIDESTTYEILSKKTNKLEWPNMKLEELGNSDEKLVTNVRSRESKN